MGGFTLSDTIFHSVPLQTLRTAAIDIIAWTNDILSLDKELARGDVHNLVVVLHHGESGSWSAAAQKAASMLDQRWRDFFAAEHELSFLPSPSSLMRSTFGGVSGTSLPTGSLDQVHRVGAAVLGIGLWVFGILGFVNRLAFLSIQGENVLGLSSNGLLSMISLIVGGILILAALRGGRISSTVTAAIGVLFLLSGLVNLAVLDTELNLLAFRMPNVIFSFIAGMLLLFLGAYGRFSGGLSEDNPYYQYRHRNDPPSTASPSLTTSVEQNSAEIDRLIAAEVAVAEGHATPEQERLVREDAQRRADEAYRRAWQRYEASQAGNPDASQTS